MSSAPPDAGNPDAGSPHAGDGSGAPPAAAVVAAHGDLAAGLVSAVDQITGRGALLRPLSNRGLGAPEIEGALRAALDATGAGAVFTDLPGGSCTMAARRLQRERPALAVATGVNLAALLEFVCAVDAGAGAAPDAGGPAPLVARAAERGRASIAVPAAPAPR